MVLPVGCGCDGADFGLAGFVTGAVATAWVALAIGLIRLLARFASNTVMSKSAGPETNDALIAMSATRLGTL